MILTPPPNFPPQLINEALKSKVPESIKTVKEDIDIFLDSAREAIKQINKTIKPYGKKVEIIPYNPKDNETKAKVVKK
jgi:ribosomal protein S20